MDELLNFIRTLTSFSDDSWRLLQPALTVQEFRKNELLLEEGEVCHALFYIVHGYCRSYYTIDGAVKNTGFFFEKEIATNVTSFGSGQPSEFNMIACEPLSVIRFDKQQLFLAAKQAPEIEVLGRHCIRVFAARQAEFANLFQLYTPLQRLEYIETKHSALLQRVSLSQLASFLGVARETLSRIRKRRTLS